MVVKGVGSSDSGDRAVSSASERQREAAKSSYSFPRISFCLVPHQKVPPARKVGILISVNTIKKIHPKCAQRLLSWTGPDLVKLKTVVATAVVDVLMFGCEPSLYQLNHLSGLVLAS